ncbi:MAG: hypothetical protein Q7J16_04550 [Candidatus Cloacimonadales bacterium]|nr:hypothetical protein [Candidatus Cloacimonadales bacterium]
MFKKIILIVLMLNLIVVIFAQEKTGITYDQKSVKKAMLLSSLFPGAGQFYADKSSFTTYIFPVLEVGLWIGYIHYYNKGLQTEKDYQNYADEYYNRAYQEYAQNTIIEDDDPEHFDNGFYDSHFRLDDTNTQHFYEDIGKYPKYIFGWIDWFNIYAIDDIGNYTTPNWHWVEDSLGVSKVYGLTGPANSDSLYYNDMTSSLYDAKDGMYSGYRQIYIDMRQSAEGYYDKGRFYSFGIIANHILAALDAVRLTKHYNRQYAENHLQFKVGPILVNNQLSAAFFVSKRF